MTNDQPDKLHLSRRSLVMGAAAMPALIGIRTQQAAAADSGDSTPFNPSVIRQLARDLAQKSFKAPDRSFPDTLKNLSYDNYRSIRFNPDQALWRSDALPFQIQFFHRGFFFSNRVDIFQVADGKGKTNPLCAVVVQLRRSGAATP
ncbi:MAG: Periplasmic glucan biosynthesis protein MdoG [Tardiphaga sp.]|nr:Periplasmic glucan biosynthesis protein MdoG [Tardiphaga sp.]